MFKKKNDSVLNLPVGTIVLALGANQKDGTEQFLCKVIGPWREGWYPVILPSGKVNRVAENTVLALDKDIAATCWATRVAESTNNQNR